MTNLQARNFTTALKNEEWLNKTKAINRLNTLNGSAEWTYIIHDKDTNDNGEIKEKHAHISIFYNTPRKISTVANFFNVEPNMIEKVASKKAIIRYNIHADNKEKYQYDQKNIITNIENIEDYFKKDMSLIEMSNLIKDNTLNMQEKLEKIPENQVFKYHKTIQLMKDMGFIQELNNEIRDLKHEIRETQILYIEKINEIKEDFTSLQNGIKNLTELQVNCLEEINKIPTQIAAPLMQPFNALTTVILELNNTMKNILKTNTKKAIESH